MRSRGDSLGRAAISPRRPVPAGAFATLTYTYTAAYPIDDSGCVLIVFRHVGDFGTPQFAAPARENYCSVSTTGHCRIEPRWIRKGWIRPWDLALFLHVRGGYLDRDDRLTVVFGDPRGGSPGWRMQTFCEKTFEFKTLVDPISTFRFKELPRSPTVRIVPGAPARAVCIAPSQVGVGERFQYHLKIEDAWGNPVGRPRRRSHPGFPAPGVQRIEAADSRTGLAATSNPIDVRDRADGTGRRGGFWGDLHGQSEETIGSNSIDDYFVFARDFALLDVAAHQGNDFQVTDAFWETINATTRRFYRSGRFVTFPGYEWSGNTPLGGDRNVYFKREGGRISRSSHDLLPGGSKRPVSATAADLFADLDGPAPWVTAHVGGRYADLRLHDPDLEVAVEIHSAWGTFEWLVEDAIRLGYRFGIVANSDDHKGRPGASYPGAGRFGSLGGLTCFLAERLDREAIYGAIRARHCYATTGHRALLDVTARIREGCAMMGDVAAVDGRRVVLDIRAAGTAPIEEIQVRNGLDVVRTHRPFTRDQLGRRIKITWSGAEVRGRDRAVDWRGGLSVRGNRIVRFVPVNFWGPARGIRRVSSNRLAWDSMTTGGSAGVILELKRPRAGTIEIETPQKRLACPIGAIGLRPRTWKAGGVAKQIRLYRLPLPAVACRCLEQALSVPVAGLRRGENPLYVRVVQEDGHMAWSSPIFVVCR